MAEKKTIRELIDERKGKQEHKRLLKQKLRTVEKRIRKIGRRIKVRKRRRGLPNWLPDKYAEEWRRPWNDYGSPFKDLIWRHGYISPNFTRAEGKCKCGTAIPDSLRGNAQRQGANLEKLRHKLGDISMPPLSWYRPQWYNQQIGGASQSRHIQADATDFDVSFIQRVGTAKFDHAADAVYSQGGFGQYPGGSRHVDSRGYRSRWTSF